LTGSDSGGILALPTVLVGTGQFQKPKTWFSLLGHSQRP
jgi:hypothetical protein